MRSTSPGKLSSSQDLSIGRSISLTRSSSVRALLLSTVLARVLKADSTADTVERDRICCGGGAAGLSSAGGSNAGCRCTARAATVSVNSRSFSGSILWNEACGSGTAISSVSSNTSPSGKGGLISAGVVASSRPLSNASMSSWLLDAAGAAADGAAGGGAGLTGGGRGRLCNGGLRSRNGRRRNVVHYRRLGARRGHGWLLRFCRCSCCRAGGLFGGRRFCFVVGDDAPDRRQNLLHRGLLDLRRLRHLRLHIINALACVLHQAEEDLPVPEMQA